MNHHEYALKEAIGDTSADLLLVLVESELESVLGFVCEEGL